MKKACCLSLMIMGASIFACKCMLENPSIIINLREGAKDLTKKAYKMLDDMD